MHEIVECFWLVPTNFQRVSLRRWSRRGCPSQDGTVCISQVILTTVEGEHPSGDLWPHDDIRWPTRCATCATPFKEYDGWQLYHEIIYKWWETDIELTLSEAPAGAMWDAYWRADTRKPGPDDRHLYVRLPDGKDWFVDGPSRGSKSRAAQAWTRAGTVPNITVTPGVRTTGWDGSLTHGLLIPKSACEDTDEDTDKDIAIIDGGVEGESDED